ncbi:MAG: glycoside hydrolase family 28 protein [Pirellulales bacterium]|nr:glycoside hydrolase family 28 protein [Pirellulales bacterium]
MKVSAVCAVGFFCCSFAMPALGAYDVREYGAAADGKTLCTAANQKAIDDAAAHGGGTVHFPPGRYLTGTLWMKSNVTLEIDAGATLLGSPNPKDYPEKLPKVRSYTDRYVRQALIAGEDLEQIAIRGRGTIDGQGASFHWKEYENRPYIIRFVGCRDVLVEGVTLQNSAMWMQHYLACDRVTIRGVRVFNHVSYNNDGLDIDGCHDVCVTECMFDSDDDALCLKSTLDRPCRNVVISNCLLSSHCNALKMGTESNGGFQNIAITNCTICSPRYSKPTYGRDTGMGGIALEIVDGGTLDRVNVSNLSIDGVAVPIFLRLGNRARPFTPDGPKPAIGAFRNVNIHNVIATGASPIGCSITGLPEHCIEGVSLSNLQLTFAGGGGPELAASAVPEHAEKYPESSMFGTLPAYGFYCRHVRGLRMHNVRLQTAEPDGRHAIVYDDVADLALSGLEAAGTPAGPALLRLAEVQRALITGCRPIGPLGTLLRLEGPSTRQITLVGNDPAGAGRMVDAAGTVPKDALSETGNRLHRREGIQ